MTDDELRNFVIAFRAGLLGRHASTQACFMLCAPLSTLLEMEGVPNTLVETQLERPRGGPLNHVWLRLSDGRALDPSADQFNIGLPPVYLGEPLPDIQCDGP